MDPVNRREFNALVSRVVALEGLLLIEPTRPAVLRLGNVWAFSTWVRLSKWSSTNIYPTMLGFFGGHELTLSAFGDRRLRVQGPGGVSVTTVGVNVLPGTWYHIAAACDGSTAQLAINGYVNRDADTSVEPVDPQPVEFAVREPVAAHADFIDWDVAETVLWTADNAPSLKQMIYHALDGEPLPPNHDFLYQSDLVPEFKPAVELTFAKVAKSGLVTLGFNVPAERGEGADRFAHPVLWKDKGAHFCHAVTSGLKAGDKLHLPRRFIETSDTGDYNSELDVVLEADFELEDVPSSGPLKLAAMPEEGDYFSEGFEYGNDLQRLKDWHTDRTWKTLAERDTKGIPVGDAFARWNNTTTRKDTEGYHLYWKGTGELYLAGVVVADEPTMVDSIGGWKHKFYAPPIRPNSLIKIGEVTEMKACWDTEQNSIDRGASNHARTQWAPFHLARCMAATQSNGSLVSLPEHLADDGYIGKPNIPGTDDHGLNLPALCRMLNDLGLEDAWFNMPHSATPECMAKFCEQVRDYLDPSIGVYMEYGNEVWNFAGPFGVATKWLQHQVATPLGLQYDDAYAMKSVEMERIGIAVLGDRYKYTVLAGQFDVPTKTNVRHQYAVARGVQRPVTSNALYMKPKIIDDEYTRTALAVASPDQMIDVVRWTIDENVKDSFALTKEYCEANNVKCIAYEGGWSWSTPRFSPAIFEVAAELGYRTPLHPKQVQLHHYMYHKAIEHGYTHMMHLAIQGGAWDFVPRKFKTWKDRNRWNQPAGPGLANPGMTMKQLATVSESPRAWAAFAWNSKE